MSLPSRSDTCTQTPKYSRATILLLAFYYAMIITLTFVVAHYLRQFAISIEMHNPNIVTMPIWWRWR